jgi:hypothetical protein
MMKYFMNLNQKLNEYYRLGDKELNTLINEDITKLITDQNIFIFCDLQFKIGNIF